jgi:hypothetical protein
VASRQANLGPLVWLMLVIGALGAGGIFLWTQDTRRGSHNPEYSVARTDDRGAALVYRVYQSAGLKPQVWDRPLTDLDKPGMLLLLAPARQTTLGGVVPIGSVGDILPDEIRSLDAWVRRGNVAVVMTRDDNPLYQSLGLIAGEPAGISALKAEPVQPGLLAAGVSAVQTQTQLGFGFGQRRKGITGQIEPLPPTEFTVPPEQWVTLFAKKDGGRSLPQVVSAARGNGLYVAVNDVFPAGNLGLTMADDAQFMLNIARLNPAGGTLWFDEHHKRNVERGFIAYVRSRSLAPALLYALLLLGLLFWRTGARFGPPEPLVPDRRRDSGEYVRAVATLYQTAGMRKEALATIYNDFRRRLVGALRLDGLTDLGEVGRRYEMRTGRPAIEARQILIETEAALAREKLDDAEALQFCARLTKVDEGLHHGRQKNAGRK